MSKIKWTSLALLLMVILDATGDAFRLEGWQVLHHMIEAAQVAGWFVIWGLFPFNPVWIVMYILGRFVTFDLVFNLIAGNDWWYVGESSLYGRFLTWFAGLVKQPLGEFQAMPKFVALVWWISWFWVNRTFKWRGD